MMLRRAVLILACVSFLVGCGGTQTASQATEESGLKPLAVFYGRFIAQHRGQPPKDEAEFRQFLGTVGAEELASFNVQNIDQIMTSSRDNQPYVVLYGAPTGPAKGPGGAPVIAYEKQGVGGKRFVASNLGGVEEVDEARFKELVPGG